jgi:hypothetical protein
MDNSIKLSEAKAILMVALRTHTPLMMWGPPGTGKSSVVNQTADEKGMNLIDVRLAQLDPTDIRGLPNLDKENKTATWYTPSFFPKRNADGNGVDGPGILFLDEIEKAPVSVKNAALQLVLDRCVGDYVLPDDWCIVCAGNREDDGCFSAPLGQALSNRMIHVVVRPDMDVWTKWARENKVADDIIGFLTFKSELLYMNTNLNAFPSPRSWTMASKLIEGVADETLRKRLMESAVGEAAITEFTVWSKVYRNVNVEEILSGKGITFKKEEQSYKYAVTLAVAFFIRKHGAKKYMTGISDFLKEVSPELRVVFMRQQTTETMSQFAKDPQYKEIVANIMELYEM